MKLWLWVFAIFLVSRIAAFPNAVPTERISGLLLFFYAFAFNFQNCFCIDLLGFTTVILILISDQYWDFLFFQDFLFPQLCSVIVKLVELL